MYYLRQRVKVLLTYDQVVLQEYIRVDPTSNDRIIHSRLYANNRELDSMVSFRAVAPIDYDTILPVGVIVIKSNIVEGEVRHHGRRQMWSCTPLTLKPLQQVYMPFNVSVLSR